MSIKFLSSQDISGTLTVAGNAKITGTQEKVLELDTTANTGAIHFEDNGTLRGILGFSNGSSISTSASNHDMVLRSEAALLLTTNASNVALTLDTSQNATFTGFVKAPYFTSDGGRSFKMDGVAFEGGYSNGSDANGANDLGSSSNQWRDLYLSNNIIADGDITLDSAGDIIFDADGGSIKLKDAGTTFGTFSKTGNDFHITANRQDGDMRFFGNDGGTSVNPLNFDMSEGGNATFSGNVGIGGSPGAKLDVNAGITNTIAIFESTDDKAFLILKDDDTSTHLITKDNKFSIGESSSDYNNFKVDISNGNTTVGGDLTVSGGDITLSGTGRIQGVDTVTDATDAANKTYVDAAVAGASGNGTLTMTTSTGLDGGATFTANQSGNSTFAVTLDLSEITLSAGLDAGATSLSLDLSEFTDMTAAMNTNDEFIVLDSSAERRKRAGEIGLSIFNNDSGFITSASLPTVNNAQITIAAGTNLNGTASFTTNQSFNETITINMDTGGVGAGTYGSTSNSTKIDNITVDAYGRVTAVTTGATGQVNQVNSGNLSTMSVSSGTTTTVTPITATVSNSSLSLATGQQIQTAINTAVTGVLKYDGTWNASTNSPTLSSGSGTVGEYYIVSVAGSTNLDGITDWAVGDWAVFSDQATDAWQKIDNTQVGNVTGSGSSGRVAFWNSDSNITSDSDLTFNGSSLVVGGTVTAQTGNSVQWFEAYNNQVTAISDSGSSTITLTLTQEDGGTLTTSFSNPQGTMSSFVINTAAGLDGAATVTNGGTVNLSLDLSELTDMTATMVGTDEFIVLDSSAERRKAANEIGLSIFNNDAGFITSSSIPSVGNGTFTVSGSSGLSGSGSMTANQSGNSSASLTNTDKGSSQSIYKNFTASSGGTATANSNNDTLTIAAGTNITTVRSGDTITINATNDGQGVTSIATTNGITGGTITSTGTLQVDSTVVRTTGDQSVGGIKTFTTDVFISGDTKDLVISNTAETKAGIVFTDAQAGTGQAAAIKFDCSTETLDFFMNDESAERMSINTAGALIINGGNIELGGTGRIQGVDTVSSGTDAANKTYVDNAISGVPQGTVTSVATTFPVQGGTITGSGTISVKTPENGDWWNGGVTKVGTDGVMEIGKYIDMHAADAATSDFDIRLTASTGSLNVSGDIVIGGGDITLSGTGRIQGVDTVSASTDAANKSYVDSAVAGVPQGTVTGTGTSGQLAIFNGSSSITSNNGLLEVSTGVLYANSQFQVKGVQVADYTVSGDTDTGLGSFDGANGVSLVSKGKKEITVKEGDITFNTYDSTSVATTGSLNPNQSNQAPTQDTLAQLCVDPSGNVVRGEQEGTWTFTRAQLNATLGNTLIAAPGANKAIIVTESDWMVKYSATGAVSGNQSFDVRQANIVQTNANISTLPGARINEIINAAQGTPTNPSYGFCARDIPLTTRTYKTNVATTLNKKTNDQLPAGVISISVKLKYRIFNADTF